MNVCRIDFQFYKKKYQDFVKLILKIELKVVAAVNILCQPKLNDQINQKIGSLSLNFFY